jgi:hypothetical protein
MPVDSSQPLPFSETLWTEHLNNPLPDAHNQANWRTGHICILSLQRSSWTFPRTLPACTLESCPLKSWLRTLHFHELRMECGNCKAKNVSFVSDLSSRWSWHCRIPEVWRSEPRREGVEVRVALLCSNAASTKSKMETNTFLRNAATDDMNIHSRSIGCRLIPHRREFALQDQSSYGNFNI